MSAKFKSLIKPISRYRLELLLFLLFATCAFLGSYQGSGMIDPIILDRQNQSFWFEADIPRIFNNLTSRSSSSHQRAYLHPLFVILSYPLVFVITHGLGLDSIIAMRLVFALFAGLWLGTIFLLLRFSLDRLLDALIFTLLAGFSAAAVFFFVIPETYSLASLSIAFGLLVVAISDRRRVADFWFVMVNVFTLGITISNWMVGILGTLFCRPWKRAIAIILIGLIIVLVFWNFQSLFFPAMGSILSGTQENRYLFMPDAGRLPERIFSIVYHSLVMPEPGMNRVDVRPNKPVISTLHSPPGSGSIWGTVAVVLWTLLLFLGLYGLFKSNRQRNLRMVLGFSLLGQIILHLIYGIEIFLYSLHFLPLLVPLAALGTFIRWRWISLTAASLLVVGIAANNLLQFEKVTGMVELYKQPRYQVRFQKQIRPEDPWPRDKGHVILAEPGSNQLDRAYHEPGGSFSPAVGSFGLSLWIIGNDGELLRTSDDIPIEEIDQEFIWFKGLAVPGIRTRTSDYEALWSKIGSGNWQLNLKDIGDDKTQLAVMIRSVGPAGGPVSSLKWKNDRILINDRWIVEIEPDAKEILFGEEGTYNWKKRGKIVRHWELPFAWGFARIVLGEAGEWNIHIRDNQIESVPKPVITQNGTAPLMLGIEDDRFISSLEAQTAHLLMGIVEGEARPGDPFAYPHAWLREGSYITAALARAGKLDMAKSLAEYLAKTDFASGYGSQADAPGLAIWGLAEVALQLNDPDFEQHIWLDVKRKAELILEMLNAEKAVYHDYESPLLPGVPDGNNARLVANPAEDGLIKGRVGEKFPLLYVNAVSYRGLMDAALLAERVGQDADANQYREAAGNLQLAWGKAINSPQEVEVLNSNSGLWQSGIAEPYRAPFRNILEERWKTVHDEEGGFIKDPGSTYFEVADAHQWLLLGDQDRVKDILTWFWDHQASPGLFTWWDDLPEESTLQEWDQVRGWIYPLHNTPQYWTAAEMLLLQMDMLAYTRQGEAGPVLVIGAGVPEEWLNNPIRVKGLRVREGLVDWEWDGSLVEVYFCGEPLEVELGAAFPADTPESVEFDCP